jgi:hypothetical protein
MRARESRERTSERRKEMDKKIIVGKRKNNI